MKSIHLLICILLLTGCGGSSGSVVTPPDPALLFSNSSTLQNATRSDSITFQREVHGLEVQLNLCSQSMSNFRLNTATVSFTRNGTVIGTQTDSYPSESTWGAIPCNANHVVKFPAIWVKAGETLRMDTSVTNGDYVNTLAGVAVYDGSLMTPEVRNCAAGTTTPFIGGILENNQWGGTPVQQCTLVRSADRLVHIHSGITLADASQGTVGWYSEWPSIGSNTPNYPQLACGQKPGMPASTNAAFPIQISNLATTPLLVSWNMDTDATGNHNLALEGWITTNAIPTLQQRSAEVMVMLSASGMVPYGTLTPGVNIGGKVYDLWSGARTDPANSSAWTIYTFVPSPAQAPTTNSAGSLDFAQFVNWLTANAYVQNTSYLSDVEMGNEIMTGRLRSVLNSFSVTLGTLSVCRLP